MKQLRPGSNIWFDLRREKDGWSYRVEQRGDTFREWHGVSFEGRETAELAMWEKIRGIEGGRIQ